MECPDFRKAAGRNWLEKAEEACTACSKCNGNFPLNPDETTEPELIDEIISDIQEKYLLDQAGCRFSFEKADYFHGSLFFAFSKAMQEVAQLHRVRTQTFFKGWMK